MPLDIVYADAHLLVLNKPSGLLSVPGRGPEKYDSLAVRAAVAFPGARPVHRLDQHTSGVIVMALDPETQRALGRQFEHRLVEKEYIAVVYGVPRQRRGVIDAPLRKCFEFPPRHCVDLEQGRPSQTCWEVLCREQDRARLKLEPRTGRSHQLRVHLAYTGYPILGDALYAPAEAERLADRLLLHAEKLALRHPASGQRLVFEVPSPF